MKHYTLLLGVFAMLTGCAALPLQPAPQKLQPWTMALRDSQPEDAFAAVYRIGSRRLVFIGAQHENQNDSLTFQMIRDGYASFKFDTVIAEGFPMSWGVNPARIFDYVSKNTTAADGFVEGGETVPTVLGAREQAARLIGGEPDDPEVKRLVAIDGITDRDLLGFYVLRNLPQWISERELNHAADPRLQHLVEKALARRREKLQVPATTLPDYATWRTWYEKTNGRPLTVDFNTEEVGPLSDGRFGTNKIAYAVSKARDAYLHRLIVDHLNANESVLVVFGGSHLLIHRPALDTVLGRPCYTGTDLKRAAASCS
jgi:hypothetical protein